MKHDIIVRKPDIYFDSLHNELNNFLRDTLWTPSAFSDPLTFKKDSVWRPSVEIKQNDQNYTVKVQLPGVKREDIEIELDNDFMTISAKMEEEKEEHEEKSSNEKYHTSEFRYGQYRRTISFDNPVKIDESDAKYKNGVLTINVPKVSLKEIKTKRLEVKE